MTIIELLIIVAHAFLYFLIAIGISTLLFPIKMSLHSPSGILLGIAFTTNMFEETDEPEVAYLFFSVHLIFFSLGIFVNLGLKQ
tara:strand:+ start:294 stop:545 length:252 start_codon:yes stop_codon:yes gene_type:complete